MQQDLDPVSSLSHVLVSDLYLKPAVLDSPLLLWENLGINLHSDRSPTEMKHSRYIPGLCQAASLLFSSYDPWNTITNL